MVDKEKGLEYSKTYSIKLLDIFGGYKSNIRIIGKTNIDNVINNTDDEYNIFKTYFEPVGLGITSYYVNITNKTVIYIGLVVDSLEPYSYTEEKVFLPESLIDWNNSNEYIKVSKLTYTIFPVIRKFSTETDLEAFKQNSKNELLNRIKSLIEFSNLDNEVNIESSDFFVIKEDYEELDKAREMEYKKYKDRIAKNNKTIFENQSLFNSKLAECERMINEYNEKKLELEEKINEYQSYIDMMEVSTNPTPNTSSDSNTLDITQSDDSEDNTEPETTDDD